MDEPVHQGPAKKSVRILGDLSFVLGLLAATFVLPLWKYADVVMDRLVFFGVLYFGLGGTGLVLAAGVSWHNYSRRRLFASGRTAAAAVVLNGCVVAALLYFAPILVAWQKERLGTERLLRIGVGLDAYARLHGGRYPPLEKWCDELVRYGVDRENFVCPTAQSDGAGWLCHYAMNPNARRDSPPETVLIFETNEGPFNRVGGPELITAENHDGGGCYILTTGQYVTFVRREDFNELLWNPSQQRE